MVRRRTPVQGLFDLPEEKAESAQAALRTTPKRATRVPTPILEQPDLFSLPPADPAPDQPSGARPLTKAARPEPVRREPMPSEPVRFMPTRVRLSQFIATAGTASLDPWLYYCVRDPAEAHAILASGLRPDRTAPPVLREAGATVAWLASLSEDDEDEDADDAPPPLLLRLRRNIVQNAMEPDPDAPQQPGSRMFLLTGDRTE